MPKMMSLGTCSFYSFKNIKTIKMPSLVVFDDIMKEVPPTILKRHNEIQEENGLKVIEELKKIINKNAEEIDKPKQLIK